MPKILILCPFPEDVAAGQRLKYEQYLDDWRESGFEVKVSSFMNLKMWGIVYQKGHYVEKIFGTIRGSIIRIFNLFQIPQYDVVYVFMWVTPVGTSFFERIVRLLAKKLVYDIEDNVMMQASNAINPIVKLLRGPGKTRYLIKNADHVITSSPFLNDYCMENNIKESCTYISSSLDTDRFIPINKYKNDHKVVIGWTGTFTSSGYLDLLREVFVKLAKNYDFKLRIIGNFDYDLPGVDLEVIRWTAENEVGDLQGIDIGVYPLEQNKWVLGKSGLKALQYMAFGLPAVATNVGTTPQIISHLENGWLVKTDDEWFTALATLIEDHKLREKLGQNARKTVLKKYSKHNIRLEYLSILNEQIGTES